MPPAVDQNELLVYGQLPEDILKYYALQLLSGLVALNQVRLAHNLISPSVIVLSPDLLRAQLTEFSFVNDVDSNDEPLRAQGDDYGAPEMIRQ